MEIIEKNNTRNLQFTESVTTEKLFFPFFCLKPPIVMEARTKQTAYCISDIVAIDAYFKNNSNKNVKPKVSLLQKQIIRGQSAAKTTRMSFQLIPLDPELVRVIKAGKDGTWKGIKFQIPQNKRLYPSVNCRLIELNYHIVIKLDCFNNVIFLPVTIGTTNNNKRPNKMANVIETEPMALPDYVNFHQILAAKRNNSRN